MDWCFASNCCYSNNKCLKRGPWSLCPSIGVVARCPSIGGCWKTHNVRTPPRSDSGEATPQNHPQETVLLQTARGFLFKSALGPTVIHHAGVEDCGAPSSWVRGYLKEKNHNSRRWEGRCWKIPKIPVKSHKEVQSHMSHEEYLDIVRVISQDSF